MSLTTIIVEGRTGGETVIQGEDGISVMELMRRGGVDEILALCGGTCSCATCHVIFDPGTAQILPPLTDQEEALLDCSDHRTATSRLACQVRMVPELEGIRIRIAPED